MGNAAATVISEAKGSEIGLDVVIVRRLRVVEEPELDLEFGPDDVKLRGSDPAELFLLTRESLEST